MIRVPFWIPVVALVAAHASGAINVFTAGAQILTGVDATVNAVIDFHKWIPQVKDKLHADKKTTSPIGILPAAQPKNNRDIGIGQQ